MQGVEKLLAPNMDVDVAFFDQNQLDFNKNTKPFYLQKHRFNRLNTKLTIVVDKKPKTIGIDPYSYLLDANLKDNWVEVK